MGIYDDGPRFVIWEATRACALACIHCRTRSVPNRNPAELTKREAFGLIDDVADIDGATLVLTGGDPLLRPDLVEIVGYAAECDVPVVLAPSGTPNLNRAALEGLASAGCGRIALHFDGPNAITHDAFRGVDGIFARTFAAASDVREFGMQLQINTTAARRNSGDLPEIAALARSLDPVIWAVFFLVPTSRAQRDDCLDGAGFERAFADLFAVWKDAPFAVTTDEAPHFRRYAAQHFAQLPPAERPPSAEHRHMPSIGDGKGSVFVSHTGEICPSSLLPIVAGNVRNERLLDTYRNDPVFERLRYPDKTKGKCGACDYRHMCGGSRARAYAFASDPFGSDPCCAYESPAYLASLERVSA